MRTNDNRNLSERYNDNRKDKNNKNNKNNKNRRDNNERDHYKRDINERDNDYEVIRERIFKKQRERILKEKKIRMILCMVSTIVLVSFVIIVGSVKGKADTEECQYKYYTGITVQYGDSLWSIADKYADKEHYDHLSYIKEVKSINHIQDENEIIAGKLLIVPYYSSQYISD